MGLVYCPRGTASMDEVQETHLGDWSNWLNWFGERVPGSLALLLVLWCIRCCWSSARANQRLSLADWEDGRNREERRGLLISQRVA